MYFYSKNYSITHRRKIFKHQLTISKDGNDPNFSFIFLFFLITSLKLSQSYKSFLHEVTYVFKTVTCY